jgi:hypothetical protein
MFHIHVGVFFCSNQKIFIKLLHVTINCKPERSIPLVLQLLTKAPLSFKPTFHPVGIMDSFPGVKEPEHESRHIPPSSAKHDVWNFISTHMCIHDVVLSQMGMYKKHC